MNDEPDDPKPVEVLGRHIAVNEPHHPPVHPVWHGLRPANGHAYEDWSGYSVPDTDIPPDDGPWRFGAIAVHQPDEDGPWNDQPF